MGLPSTTNGSREPDSKEGFHDAARVLVGLQTEANEMVVATDSVDGGTYVVVGSRVEVGSDSLLEGDDTGRAAHWSEGQH
jgi:hypothetical protein